MDSFRIEFARSATKDLRGIDRQWIPIILGCKKLAGSEHTFRIRVGDYPIVYDIQGADLVVYVVRVRHRRDGYR